MPKSDKIKKSKKIKTKKSKKHNKTKKSKKEKDAKIINNIKIINNGEKDEKTKKEKKDMINNKQSLKTAHRNAPYNPNATTFLNGPSIPITPNMTNKPEYNTESYFKPKPAVQPIMIADKPPEPANPPKAAKPPAKDKEGSRPRMKTDTKYDLLNNEGLYEVLIGIGVKLVPSDMASRPKMLKKLAAHEKKHKYRSEGAKQAPHVEEIVTPADIKKKSDKLKIQLEQSIGSDGSIDGSGLDLFSDANELFLSGYDSFDNDDKVGSTGFDYPSTTPPSYKEISVSAIPEADQINPMHAFQDQNNLTAAFGATTDPETPMPDNIRIRSAARRDGSAVREEVLSATLPKQSLSERVVTSVKKVFANPKKKPSKLEPDPNKPPVKRGRPPGTKNK